jgi:NAD(P)-dependent dehydrogenase (short-subunit alcohol dehydrogenase family)
VSRPDALRELADRTLEEFGAVHLLFNNAGVFAAGGPVWETPIADYEWQFAVNVMGVIHGIRTFVPILLEQGEESHIVNTASMAGLTTCPLSSAYYVSKHAALSLSETLYLELTQRGAPIGVSVLCPELVDTRIGNAERNRQTEFTRKDEDIRRSSRISSFPGGRSRARRWSSSEGGKSGPSVAVPVSTGVPSDFSAQIRRQRVSPSAGRSANARTRSPSVHTFW